LTGLDVGGFRFEFQDTRWQRAGFGVATAQRTGYTGRGLRGLHLSGGYGHQHHDEDSRNVRAAPDDLC
jgi:hypothetical protein